MSSGPRRADGTPFGRRASGRPRRPRAAAWSVTRLEARAPTTVREEEGNAPLNPQNQEFSVPRKCERGTAWPPLSHARRSGATLLHDVSHQGRRVPPPGRRIPSTRATSLAPSPLLPATRGRCCLWSPDESSSVVAPCPRRRPRPFSSGGAVTATSGAGASESGRADLADDLVVRDPGRTGNARSSPTVSGTRKPTPNSWSSPGAMQPPDQADGVDALLVTSAPRPPPQSARPAEPSSQSWSQPGTGRKEAEMTLSGN